MENLKIGNIIREEIQKFLEDYKFDNSQKTFMPTDLMAKNCQDALNAIQSNDLTTSGSNEGSGKSKAKSIINKEPINHSSLKRMKAFFDNNQKEYQSEKSKGLGLNNSGIIQSWNLWGGDAARDFSNSKIGYTQRDNQSRKDLKTSITAAKTSTLMDPHNTRIKRK